MYDSLGLHTMDTNHLQIPLIIMIIHHPSNKQIYYMFPAWSLQILQFSSIKRHLTSDVDVAGVTLSYPWQWMVSLSSLKKRSGWNKWPFFCYFCYLWGATCCAIWSRCWGIKQRIVRPSNIQDLVDIVCLIHFFLGIPCRIRKYVGPESVGQTMGGTFTHHSLRCQWLLS